MNSKHIVFTKPNTAELLSDEIGLPKADQVQVALEISTISSGTERANLIGEVNVSIGKHPATARFPGTAATAPPEGSCASERT